MTSVRLGGKIIGDIMKNIPKKIYLQIGEDADIAEDFSELSKDDITWNDKQIFDNDIEYTCNKQWIPSKE